MHSVVSSLTPFSPAVVCVSYECWLMRGDVFECHRDNLDSVAHLLFPNVFVKRQYFYRMTSVGKAQIPVSQ